MTEPGFVPVSSGRARLLVTLQLHGCSSGDQDAPLAWPGPTYLRRADIALWTVQMLHAGIESGQYDLDAWVIMPNHVQALLVPKVDANTILDSLKGWIANGANLLLNRAGEPFWRQESDNHWIRDEMECSRIVAAIENKPVQAGFVSHPEEYPWSSACGHWHAAGGCATYRPNPSWSASASRPSAVRRTRDWLC
jgi:REP element-mobilizing transposase RayT